MQKQSFMGTKIAQKGLFFKTFEKFGFLVVNLVGIDITFEKKNSKFFSQFSKTGPWVTKNVKKKFLFLYSFINIKSACKFHLKKGRKIFKNSENHHF